MKRYEITRSRDPYVAGMDELIGTNLTWQQALLIMASAESMDVDYAIASLDYKGAYSFLDENGNICWLKEYAVDGGSNGK